MYSVEHIHEDENSIKQINSVVRSLKIVFIICYVGPEII